jgi:flagellar biosynthesis protein FlhG
MSDQAAQLRRMVLRTPQRPSAPPPPRTVALIGGKGGVGVTTLAVQLSIAYCRLGWRVVLVDANLYRADVATMCGIREQGTIADVMLGRRNIHEILLRGPDGLQIAPGVWAPSVELPENVQGERRLQSEISTLGRHTDIVLIDLGSGANRLVRRFWAESSHVVLVSTPDPVGIMDTYATLKTLDISQRREEIYVIVNRANDREAQSARQQLQRSCQRLLARQIKYLGRVPEVERLRRYGASDDPEPDQPAMAPSMQEIAGSLGALAR